MRFIWLISQDPHHNLATEEYLLKNCDEDIFMLWQNHNAVIIGCHQNTLAEINLDYINQNNISVVRRLTGGGAVYHDVGNLNFTFIKTVSSSEKAIDFKKYTQPIIDALQLLNIPAEFSGRNDLTIEGKKFSGNSMLFYKNRVLEHGTLLFSTQKSILINALKADPEKFSDKAVKSIQSRVTNISEHLKQPLNVIQFKDYIMQSVMKSHSNKSIELLSEKEETEISQLIHNKYATWEWNYGKSPKYAFNRKIRTEGGSIELILDIKQGKIEDIKFYGDFFSTKNIEDIENKLKGIPHNKTILLKIFDEIDITSYFNKVTLDDLHSLFF